jgi:protein TonB
VTADPNVRNVAPEYPAEAVRRRERGLVKLALRIDIEGRVLAVAIVKSSGFPRLDEAARKTLSTWRFRPAFKDGHAVESVLEQPIEFTN